jgi:hypothetical protein
VDIHAFPRALLHANRLTGQEVIYFIYSFFCHQLPERSFFLFGEKSMYSLGEIQAVWQNTANPMILRQFIGNESMGWKIAWSDRMIGFTTAFGCGQPYGIQFEEKSNHCPGGDSYCSCCL